MITIVPKPTDSVGDNSTSMVTDELTKAGTAYRIMDPDSIDPLSGRCSGN